MKTIVRIYNTTNEVATRKTGTLAIVALPGVSRLNNVLAMELIAERNQNQQ